MKESGSWAQGFKRYEQLRVINDMNDLGLHELRPIDAMNRSRLWMIWTILCHELKPLDCYELLRDVKDMNDYRSWAQGSRHYEQLRVAINMNDFQ